MIIFKYTMLIMLLFISSYIGILMSKKYQYRVKELKEMKTALSIFVTKIKLTYESIPQIFKELSKETNTENINIRNIFEKASEKMEEKNAGEAWIDALKQTSTNLKKEDIEILKKLSNLLGKVDLEGQINEIELVDNFLDKQIEKAEEELKKNEKMYKTLGITVGLAICIVLV